MRFPVEVVRRTREALGDDFLVMYRLSLLDLVEDGQTWDEVVALAKALEEAGASVLNTGIGWHEARVPTILTQVPRGAWAWTTGRLRPEVGIPVCASNRINTPEVAEQILAEGQADLVSMARPCWPTPTSSPRRPPGARTRSTPASPATRPAWTTPSPTSTRAAWSTRGPPGDRAGAAAGARPRARRVAVVGAGPAGLATAVSAAERGHEVTLFEAAAEVGGQFRLAMRVPGKEEFAETLRYYTRRLEVLGVDVRLSTRATVDDLTGFDDVVVSTGVLPRVPELDGIDHPKVVSYAAVLDGSVVPGRQVAVMGAGGIGVDVSHFLTHDLDEDLDAWMAHWGVGDPALHPGGLTEKKPRTPAREVHLLQRKSSAIGTEPRQDLGLGAPRGAQGLGRADGPRRDLRAGRRRRAPRPRGWRGRRARARPSSSTWTTWSCAPGRSRSGPCTTPWWPPGSGPTWSAGPTWRRSSTPSGRSSRGGGGPEDGPGHDRMEGAHGPRSPSSIRP